jgi:hypothetical protein
MEHRALDLCVAPPAARMGAVEAASPLVSELFRTNGSQPLTSL